MLKKFAVTNFRGFADRIEWDLSNPSNYEFSQYAIKDGIVKNAIIYGPNGSGKSNFSFAVFDIVNHLTQKNKQDDYYVNFAHAAHLDSPVKFEYSFKLGEYDILYVYTKDIGGILLTEELTVNGKKIIRRKEKDITYDASLVINKKAMNLIHRFYFDYIISKKKLYLKQLQNHIKNIKNIFNNSKVKVDGNVDTSKKGSYVLTYSVYDSSNVNFPVALSFGAPPLEVTCWQARIKQCEPPRTYVFLGVRKQDVVVPFSSMR